MNLEIKSIDLERDIEFAYAARNELLFSAFGRDPAHWPERLRDWNIETYKQRLKRHTSVNSNFAVHAWSEGEIVGQCEMNVNDTSNSGYVSLHFFSEKHRSKGIGQKLDEFATNVFKEMKFTEMALTVEQKNLRAQEFYKRNGWTIFMPSPRHETGIEMRNLI